MIYCYNLFYNTLSLRIHEYIINIWILEGISVGPVSTVEIVIGDKRGNQIILPYATWEMLSSRDMLTLSNSLHH